MVDLGIGFAVEVRKDCPHVDEAGIKDLTIERARELMGKPCGECGHKGEVWFNLTTHEVLCSRYAKGHMLDRASEMKAANEARYGSDQAAAGGGESAENGETARHAGQIAVSALDLSVWCFECDGYIESATTQPSVDALCAAKFGGGDDDATSEASAMHPANILADAARQAGIVPGASDAEAAVVPAGALGGEGLPAEAEAEDGASGGGGGGGGAAGADPTAGEGATAPRGEPLVADTSGLPPPVAAARIRDIAVATCNGAMEQLAGAMGMDKPEEDASPRGILPSLDLEGIAAAIRAGDVQSITLLTGAGISVSAGIPDFRSKGGLYEQLRKQGLPGGMSKPEDLFSIDFFTQRSARPFYERARTMLFSSAAPRPTACHHFQKLLLDKGLIKRIYTQNIDSLEFKAGIPKEQVMQCHGGMSGAHCPKCGREVDLDELERRFLETNTLPRCKDCGATPKPDIVFFGEDLPASFERCVKADFMDARRAFTAKMRESQGAMLGRIEERVKRDFERGVTSDTPPLVRRALETPADGDSWNLRLHSVRAAAEEEGRRLDLVALLVDGAEPAAAPRTPVEIRAALRGGPFDLGLLRREAGGSDLFLVLGTSLKVHPVCSLPSLVLPGTARGLFNLERVGDFDSESDAVVLGGCDKSCLRLAELLGWGEELEGLMGGGGGGERAGAGVAGAADPGATGGDAGAVEGAAEGGGGVPEAAAAAAAEAMAGGLPLASKGEGPYEEKYFLI